MLTPERLSEIRARFDDPPADCAFCKYRFPSSGCAGVCQVCNDCDEFTEDTDIPDLLAEVERLQKYEPVRCHCSRCTGMPSVEDLYEKEDDHAQ